MKFSRQLLQNIRERTDMVELVNQYTRLEQRGDRWWGLSPFKQEKTPSFSVKPEEGLYYCFATQKGGDLFSFIGEMEGLSFPESVEILAERAGIAVETTPADEEGDRERRSLYELYERVTRTFSYLLEEDVRGGAAREYAHGRGLDADVRVRFELGYAVDDGRWLYRFLQRKSYSTEFLDRCGLFSRRSQGFTLFRNRLIFPIRDERRRVVAFGGRALSPEDRAKYINSPETPIYNKKRTLYGLHLAMEAMRRTKRVYVAEGYMDVIALQSAGVENAVAPLGTAFTEEQARLLKRWINEIYLVFDADQAGIDATFRAAGVAERVGLGCRAIAVPSGKDPAELYANRGVEGVIELTERSVPVFEYLLEAAMTGINPRDSRSRELLLRKLFPYINIISSEVRRETLVGQISDTIQVSPAAVMADFTRWRKGEQPQSIAEPEKTPQHITTSRDMKLMLATAHDGELFAYLRGKVSPTDLDDEVARRVFYMMEDAYRHEESLPRGLVDRLDDEQLRSFVLERLTSGEFTAWSKNDIDNAVGFVRIRKLEIRQRELERSLSRLDGTDLQEIRRVQEQKIAIDHELAQLKVRADD
ncbi:MAG: DNA primase [Spirochaeta sp.]|jgi:DNA primase|nr:DNA primase [Spirochaeta sp.]